MFNIKPMPVGNIHDNTAEQLARKIDRRMKNHSTRTWSVGFDRQGQVFHIDMQGQLVGYTKKLKIIGYYTRKVDRDWLMEDIQSVIGAYAEVA